MKIAFDRIWNVKYAFHCCGDCNGLVIDHRPEKCMSALGIYGEKIVKRFTNNIMMIEGTNDIIKTLTG